MDPLVTGGVSVPGGFFALTNHLTQRPPTLLTEPLLWVKMPGSCQIVLYRCDLRRWVSIVVVEATGRAEE